LCTISTTLRRLHSADRETWTVREAVLTLVGTLSMVAAIVYFIVALLTPRSGVARTR